MFNFAAVLALLLFVATVVLWVRSPDHRDSVSFRHGSGGMLSAMSYPGWVECRLTTTDVHLGREHKWHVGSLRWDRPIEQDDGSRLVFIRPEPADWARWNFGAKRWPAHVVDPKRIADYQGPAGGYTMFYWSVAVPHWFLVALTAVMCGACAVPALRGVRAARRAKQGLCVGCGYDLRATPGRCPECGAMRASSEI